MNILVIMVTNKDVLSIGKTFYVNKSVYVCVCMFVLVNRMVEEQLLIRHREPAHSLTTVCLPNTPGFGVRLWKR